MKNILTQFALDTKVTELQYDTGDTFSSSFQGILNAVIGVLALVAVVVMIVGGVSYMTSSGDAGKVKKSQRYYPLWLNRSSSLCISICHR